MTSPTSPEYLESEDRLRAVAGLLAGGLLRERYRRLLKAIPGDGTTENRLEVCAPSSAHVLRNALTGERST